MKSFVFLAMTMAAAPAFADVGLTLALPGATALTSQTYRCGESAFEVRYITAGGNSLAVLPVEGEERIFVNVISGSGARYASGPYIWWSKGDSATLESEMEEGSLIECQAAD